MIQKSLQERFIFLFVSVLLFRFTMMPINSLLDSETMEFLNREKHRDQYGQYRIWGTIGWAVVTPIMGYILLKTFLY